MPLRSANSPRKRLLVHLSQAVETLALRRTPGTFDVPFMGTLSGNVKVQFFEVTSREFEHFENVSQALTRLDQGTFGTCSRCGRPIESGVLAEAPLATRCIECADQESHP